MTVKRKQNSTKLMALLLLNLAILLSEDTMNKENENMVFHLEDEIIEIIHRDNDQIESVNVNE